MKYNVYNGTNPIKEEVYSKIYKIIINNYGIREKLNTKELKKKDTVAAYNNWIHTILYTKDYNIVAFYNTSNTIIGFIAFMYTEAGLCLSEVQMRLCLISVSLRNIRMPVMLYMIMISRSMIFP